MIPIVCDPEYEDVLRNPEKYTKRDEDIERRACKLEGNLAPALSLKGYALTVGSL